jgi:hypothetical protein
MSICEVVPGLYMVAVPVHDGPAFERLVKLFVSSSTGDGESDRSLEPEQWQTVPRESRSNATAPPCETPTDAEDTTVKANHKGKGKAVERGDRQHHHHVDTKSCVGAGVGGHDSDNTTATSPSSPAVLHMPTRFYITPMPVLVTNATVPVKARSRSPSPAAGSSSSTVNDSDIADTAPGIWIAVHHNGAVTLLGPEPNAYAEPQGWRREALDSTLDGLEEGEGREPQLPREKSSAQTHRRDSLLTTPSSSSSWVVEKSDDSKVMLRKSEDGSDNEEESEQIQGEEFWWQDFQMGREGTSNVDEVFCACCLQPGWPQHRV